MSRLGEFRIKEPAMRTVTGAILIAGAIWLFTSALPYGNAYGNMPIMVKLAFILSGMTAIIGAFYLFAGCTEVKENARWYQFTIKSLLAITVMVALFFSGRALGLRESMSLYSPYSSTGYIPVPIPSSYAPTPVYGIPAVPIPSSGSVSPIDSSTNDDTPPGVTPLGPSQNPPAPESKPTPSTPPNSPSTQTPY
jgi:hypothetical protein